MPRAASGTIIEDRRGDTVRFGARFPWGGRKHFVSFPAARTREDAEVELANLMADVRRGRWHPATLAAVVEAPREIPTFHAFASQWFERQQVEGGRRGGGLTDAGAADLRWRLESHLLPWFADQACDGTDCQCMRLDKITVEEVDRFRLAKVREAKLNATSINKCLQVLSAILESGVEYEHIPRNVAAGRRRRLPSVTPRRTFLDRADHIAALLDGAKVLDDTALSRRGQRRALLATLVFAGLRIGEALALNWGEVDLARGTLTVRQGKTDAAAREINVLPVLGDELRSYKASIGVVASSALVFGTSSGKRRSYSNVRSRILAAAIVKANERLSVDDNGDQVEDAVLISTKLTPHSLRRTFASILFAIGEAPPYVMAQMGHTTANLTLSIYAREMSRRDGEPERLKALVEGTEWTATDSNGESETVEAGEGTRS
jgi:integrase